MNDEVERWILFDGPEPDLIHPFLEALREPVPMDPEEDERVLRSLLERLEAALPPRDETPGAEDAPPPAPPSEPPPAVRRPPVAPASTAEGPPPLGPRDASGPVLLDDAEVQSAPPTPAPAPEKEEKAPEPPPFVARRPSSLKETANSFGAACPIQPALSASAVRPAPAVQVVGAKEHSRTLELPVMDPSQGARPAVPEMTLYDYVAYRTQVELWPEHSAHFRKKYGVEGEAGHQELMRTWERDLAESPTLRALADRMQASWVQLGREMQQQARSGGT
jgi:hypothetical protein